MPNTTSTPKATAFATETGMALVGEDEEAWIELQEDWAKELQQETEVRRGVDELLGGKLTRPPYPERWHTIGCRHLVEHGARADWILGPPRDAHDYTRRERYTGAMHDAMLTAIAEELERGVIELISSEDAPYLMPAFVVSKANGKVRLILDCRSINVFIIQQPFKMTDWLVLKTLILPGMHAVTLDVTAAFHHLGVDEQLRRLLCFRYDGRTYRYRGLPFGLRSAPRLFCEAMTATMNAVRKRWDVVAFAYMDDLLILHPDPHVLSISATAIVSYLRWLGWTLNEEKCNLTPSTSFTYLGMTWDTRTMTVRMTTEKNRRLKRTVRDWTRWTRGARTVRARDIARLIGLLNSTRPQHECASLYLARLNRLKCQAVGADGWEARTQLSRSILPELHWWRRVLSQNVPNDIRPFRPASDVTTDASETGWGGWLVLHAQPHRDRERWLCGWWTREAANCMRELMAVIMVVKASLRRGWLQEDSDILIHSDNTNVVYNLRKKRAGWRMRKAIKAFTQWLAERRIRIDCVHIPGVDNQKADSLSRLARSGDYSLKPGILAEAERQLGVKAEVDLFASSSNAQTARYCTTTANRRALTIHGQQARNALAIPNWAEMGVGLVHPPIPVIPRALAKIRRDGATAIFVAPSWPGAIWSSILRQMTVRGPVVLGECEEVLEKGRTMLKRDYALPPGTLAAYLLRGRPDATQTPLNPGLV